jgi:tetratricopeptide (TPR) repeat protein
MQAERDHLRLLVFPELEERLRARRGFLEWVDLRVGVATASQPDEETRELHVLKVCLDEVKRCRPFLIVLLGDRYGWVPPEHRITAAAEEAQKGFSANVAGRSVTDLEIDFGILSNPDQQTRSFFYFRDPLPYGEMPQATAAMYADSSGTDSAALDRVARLAALKARITKELPDRVRSYHATWNAERQCVTGLEHWGRMVLDDVWSEIEAELGPSVPAAPSWQRIEADARDDFFQDRARDFVGRQALCARLVDFAAGIAPLEVDRFGICVTGEPGSGKSALFGELFRRLNDKPLVLLSHAAGASPQAVSLESMLRRWIDDLSKYLNADPTIPDDADPDHIIATFTSLLHQTCQQTRVVLLIDALDQLEATTAAQYLTWLPKPWPNNARLLVSAIPGVASESLATRGGVGVPLPPLDATEATAIIDGICLRYHRQFEPEVIQALLGTSAPGGFAWQNPLWLVLAVEELNLLDADDFTRAQQTYNGEPAERLRALMIDMIRLFPPDVPGLYKRTFARADEQFGIELSRDFLDLIAVSRGGWRESDFRIMLPRISSQPWEELKFAQLRRLYRGQIQKRGSYERWNFNHAQMRAAALTQLEASGLGDSDLHSTIVDRLLSCPTDDPLRISEVMFHLVRSKNWQRAAVYLGNAALKPAEAAGASRTLIEMLSTGDASSSPGLDAIGHLLDAGDLDLPESRAITEVIVNRILYDLHPLLAPRLAPDVQIALTARVHRTARALLGKSPNNQDRRYDFAMAEARIGQAYAARGQDDDALQAYRQSFLTMEPLVTGRDSQGQLCIQTNKLEYLHGSWLAHADSGHLYFKGGYIQTALDFCKFALQQAEQLTLFEPSNPLWQANLASSHRRMGEVQIQQGDVGGAMTSYHAAKTIYAAIAEKNPKSIETLYRLADTAFGEGEVRKAAGWRPFALIAYNEARAAQERLLRADPYNFTLLMASATTLERLGDVHMAQGEMSEATSQYQACFAIWERLFRTDPANADWHRGMLIALERLGDTFLRAGDLDEALVRYRATLSGKQELLRLNPNNVTYKKDVAVTLTNVGRICGLQDRLDENLQNQLAALHITQELAEADPENADLQQGLGFCCGQVGAAYFGLKQLDKTLEFYNRRIAIFRSLIEKNPVNQATQQALAEALDRAADILTVREDFATALSFLEECFNIHQQWNNPADIQELIELTQVMAKMMKISWGSPAHRIISLREFRKLLLRGTEIDRGNPSWTQELAWADAEISNMGEKP